MENNNRIIKFRVWNIEDKCWDNPSILEVWNDKGKLEPFQYIKSGKLDPIYTPIENYIIQQFTGLLDKNNKEIYEGDILELKNEESYLDSYKHSKFIVKWNGYYLAFFENIQLNIKSYMGDDPYRFIKCFSKYSQIIGNIFENPDLLK